MNSPAPATRQDQHHRRRPRRADLRPHPADGTASPSPSTTATRARTPATRAAPSTCTPTTARSPCARPACSTSSSSWPGPKGQEMRQLDPHGAVLAHHVPEPRTSSFKPEIDRGQLRDLLLDSLEPGTVRWGHAARRRSAAPADGPRRLHFADGTTVETDLVIGADGAFSRVRPAVLAPPCPQYTGVTLPGGLVRRRREPAPRPRRAGRPGQRPRGRRRPRPVRPAQQRRPHPRSTSSSGCPLDWITASRPRASTTPPASVRRTCSTSSPAGRHAMRQMITDNDGPYVDRPIFALPVPHTWDAQPDRDPARRRRPPHAPARRRRQPRHARRQRTRPRPGRLHHVDEAIRTYEKTMLPRSTDTARILENGAEGLLERHDGGEIAAPQH